MSGAKYLPVPAAFFQVTGTRPHPATCWRWSTQGSRGVRLETWVLGSRRMTTVEAVRDFIAKRTQDATPGVEENAVRRQLAKELGN